jgi:hypothetical protein
MHKSPEKISSGQAWIRSSKSWKACRGIGDNTVRNGEICNADSTDERVQGVRQFISDMAQNPILSATAIQTVGLKVGTVFASPS